MTETKDFDRERLEEAKQRGVTFNAGGKTFHVRKFVPPEMLVHFDDWTAADAKTTIAGFDEFILGMIEPSEAKAWREVRKKADPPLNMSDVENIAFWLLGEAAGRPTTPPLPLPPGSGVGARTSAEA